MAKENKNVKEAASFDLEVLKEVCAFYRQCEQQTRIITGFSVTFLTIVFTGLFQIDGESPVYKFLPLIFFVMFILQLLVLLSFKRIKRLGDGYKKRIKKLETRINTKVYTLGGLKRFSVKSCLCFINTLCLLIYLALFAYFVYYRALECKVFL